MFILLLLCTSISLFAIVLNIITLFHINNFKDTTNRSTTRLKQQERINLDIHNRLILLENTEKIKKRTESTFVNRDQRFAPDSSFVSTGSALTPPPIPPAQNIPLDVSARAISSLKMRSPSGNFPQVHSAFAPPVPIQQNLPTLHIPAQQDIPMQPSLCQPAAQPNPLYFNQQPSFNIASNLPRKNKSSRWNAFQNFIKVNILALVGIGFLLIGLGYLVSYAIEKELINHTAKLIIASSISLILLLSGFALIKKKRAYSLILQGGGFAGFYITIFATSIICHYFASLIVLALMAFICILLTVTAVAQNSFSLITIGCLGAYFAPFLSGTYTTNTAIIFLYFFLISGMIVTLKFYRNWAELSLLAIFFFSVALLSTLLLIEKLDMLNLSISLAFVTLLSILLGIIDPIAHSRIQPLFIKKEINTAFLVLMPALIGFIGTIALLHAEPRFIKLIVAIAWGIIYLFIGSLSSLHGFLLSRHIPPILYWGQGILFIFLAFPIGISSVSLIGLLWTINGTFISMIGAKANSGMLHALGLAIVSAGFTPSFILISPFFTLRTYREAAFNAILVIAAGIIIWLVRNQSKKSNNLSVSMALYKKMAAILISTAWFLLMIQVCREFFISNFYKILSPNMNIYLPVITICMLTTISSLVMYFFGKYSRWKWFEKESQFVWLLHIIFLILTYMLSTRSFSSSSIPREDIEFIIAGFLFYLAQRIILESHARNVLFPWLYSVTLYSTLLQFSCFITCVVRGWLHLGNIIDIACHGLYLSLIMAITTLLWERPQSLYRRCQLRWPIQYQIPFIILLVCFFLTLLFKYAVFDSFLHLYLPVVNPIEITQIVILVVLTWWALRNLRVDSKAQKIHRAQTWRIVTYTALAAICFISSLIARLISTFLHVKWDFFSLWDSIPLQISFTVFWTLSALAIMLIASKKNLRTEWFIGMGLLIIALTKLILNDASSNLIWRAFTFILVALFILAVAFINPLPGRESNEVFFFRQRNQQNEPVFLPPSFSFDFSSKSPGQQEDAQEPHDTHPNPGKPTIEK